MYLRSYSLDILGQHHFVAVPIASKYSLVIGWIKCAEKLLYLFVEPFACLPQHIFF